MDENDPLDLLGSRIALAREGDAEAARMLIAEFCTTVRNNRTGGELGGAPLLRAVGNVPYRHTSFDERLLDFLAECFEGDGRVSLAPTTQGRRGRPNSKEAKAESLARGQHVYELLRTANRVPPLLRPYPVEFTVDKAIQFVADGGVLERTAWEKGFARKFAPKSEDTVKRDYAGWRARLKTLDAKSASASKADD